MTATFSHIFGDSIVNASILNRTPGRVLDLALKHPVTITRREEQFVLLPREVISKYVESDQYTQVFSDILLSVIAILSEQKIKADNPYVWLSVFDSDELLELINEISFAYRTSRCSGSWDEFVALVHEWKESAIALASPELESAFNSEEDRVPITA